MPQETEADLDALWPIVRDHFEASATDGLLTGGKELRGRCWYCGGNNCDLHLEKRVFSCRNCDGCSEMGGGLIHYARHYDLEIPQKPTGRAGTTTTRRAARVAPVAPWKPSREPKNAAELRWRGRDPERADRVLNPDGDLFGIHGRFPKFGKDGKPILDKFGKPKKDCPWWRNGAWTLGDLDPSDAPLYGSENLPRFDRSRPVFVHEGEKAATAGRWLGLQSLGTVTGGGRKTPKDAVLRSLEGFDVVLWPDADTDGAQHAETVAGRLLALGIDCRILDLDALWPDGGPNPKDDAAEWIEKRLGDPVAATDERKAAAVEELEHLAGEAPEAESDLQHEDDERPSVRLSTEIAATVDEVLGILGNLPPTDLGLYQRAGMVVHVTREPRSKKDRRKGAPPRIATVDKARLRDVIDQRVRFYRVSKEGDELPASVPAWVPETILSRPEWPFAPLTGVTESPFLRWDGTVCSTPGYDERTGMILLKPKGATWLDVPDRPTQDDAKKAADELLEPFSEFPFAGEEHRAVVAALVLSILAREAYDGPTPLFLADAPTPGSGKTKLIQAATLIGTGRSLSLAPWSSREEERRKTITARLLDGDPVCCFDNVATGQTLGGSSLDLLLTSTRWSDRVLGKTETVKLENRTVWTATANNCNVGGDTARRALMVRLVPDTDRPELRTFNREDLLEYVKRERPRLHRAGLTMLRAWWAEHGHRIEDDLGGLIREQRAAGLNPFGSFEGWSVVVRGAVAFAGLADPATTREMLRDKASAELDELAQLVALLAEYQEATRCREWTTGDLCRVLKADQALDAPKYGDLSDLLSSMARQRGGAIPSSRSVGKILAGRTDRVVSVGPDAKAAIRRSGERSRAAVWTVESEFMSFSEFGGATRETNRGAVSNSIRDRDPEKLIETHKLTRDDDEDDSWTF